MNDNKALLDRAPEIVAALNHACHDCNPTPCCEYEVVGKDAVALIEALDAENAQLRALNSDLKALAKKLGDGLEAKLLACDRMQGQLAAVTAERDAAVECIRDIQEAAKFQRLSAVRVAIAKWRGPQGSGR